MCKIQTIENNIYFLIDQQQIHRLKIIVKEGLPYNEENVTPGFLLCSIKSPFKQIHSCHSDLKISDVKLIVTSKLHSCYELHKHARMCYEANIQ